MVAHIEFGEVVDRSDEVVEMGTACAVVILCAYRFFPLKETLNKRKFVTPVKTGVQ